MTDKIYQPTKEELEAKFAKLRKQIEFFRKKGDKIDYQMYRDYNLKMCNGVEELIGVLEGFPPDLIQSVLEIFPGSKRSTTPEK